MKEKIKNLFEKITVKQSSDKTEIGDCCWIMSCS